MLMRRPANPLSRLDMHLRGQGIGIIQRGGLHINDSGQVVLVGKEQPRPASWTEVAHRSTRRIEGCNLTPR